MPISNSYPKGVPIEDQDLFVGTKAANNRTVNYTAQGVADYLNINSKVAIGGQMSFQFTVVPNIPKTIAFEGGLGDGTAFSAITKLIVSAIDLSTANITIFLSYLNNSQVLLSQQNQPNFFGHYKITGYTQIGTSTFYELDLEFIGGNGTIGDKQYYDLVSFVLSAEVTVPNLQEVTDAGNTTTNPIIVGGITSGNLYSDGFIFGISDNYDSNYNLLYTPYGGGLQINDGVSNYVVINQNASISFQTALGGGGLRSDLLTGYRTWQLPDADGTLALTTDIGTWGALNYPTWTAGAPFVKMTAAGTFALDTTIYYPVPTGTIAEYIRGDGSLATFPTPTIPTLQQVLDNNHDLVNGNNFQGTSAGLNNTGSNVNAFGYVAGRANTKDSLNAFGYFAGDGNTGTYVNVFGRLAGIGNTGDNLNAFGISAASSNTGKNVNAFGSGAGLNNTFKDVNLFGEGAIADSKGQTVFSFLNDAGTQIYNGRLSFAQITGNRKWELPNASGTIPLTVNGNSADITGAITIPVGTGTVASVGLTMPSAFIVANSPITSSGDIAVTGAGLVSQYIRGDGTLANFPNSTGGGSSVNYYLNGSVSQGTFGGTTYYQMSKTPILGAGTNFTRTNEQGNGYIASFITDAGDPNQLNIPGGNWNVEFYFNASSGGGSPSFYAELYKVSATNVFTLIASDSLNPEGITNGTTVDQYFSSIPVPQTTLLATDRLAVRIFVNTGGRTITLHTENGNLSEVLTTFTTGLTALNGLTDQVQYFDVGTGATNLNIVSSGDTHTFNLLFNIRRNANNSSNNNINYNGYAVTGSAESSAVWTITRLTIAASGSITVATATNVAWTNRESAIYT